MQNAHATRADIDEIKGILRTHDAKFDAIDERFDRLEAEHRRDTTDMAETIRNLMESIDERFTLSEARADFRFQKIEKTFAQIIRITQNTNDKIDAFLGRIDTYDTENAARDTKYLRLTDWAHKTGKSTGIPFEEA